MKKIFKHCCEENLYICYTKGDIQFLLFKVSRYVYLTLEIHVAYFKSKAGVNSSEIWTPCFSKIFRTLMTNVLYKSLYEKTLQRLYKTNFIARKELLNNLFVRLRHGPRNLLIYLMV